MFNTPPPNKMVKTRSAASLKQKEEELLEHQKKTQRVDKPQNMPPPAPSPKPGVSGIGGENKEKSHAGSVMKSEQAVFKTPLSHTSSRHKNLSSTHSIQSQKRRLQLEAAKAKAHIEMSLIDKQLEADLADLEDEYSPQHSDIAKEDAGDVARWVERSQQELDFQHATMVIENGKPQPSSPLDTNIPVQQLASALKDLVTTSTTQHNNNLLSRLSTPKELPIFNGDPMEWLSFRQAFEESTDVCSFTDKENIWRLRKCLRGQARDAVTALLISGSSPAEVMSTLQLQFGNTEIILSRLLADIKKLNSLPLEYHKDIVQFSIKVKNYVAAVRALGREEYLQGIEVTAVLLSKMPPTLLSKWTDYSFPFFTTYSPRPRLDILSSFLTEEAVKITTCSASLLQPMLNSFKRKQFENVNSVQSALVSDDARQSELKCRFCKISKHKLIECKKFKKALRKDRWQHVKRYGICYKCLIACHRKEECPASCCGVEGCGEAHHRLLHYVPRNEVSDTTTSEKKTETVPETVSHINISTPVLLKVLPINIHGPSGIVRTFALLDDGSTVTLISSHLAEEAGLSGRQDSLRVRGAFDDSELVCQSQLVNLKLTSTYNNNMFKINARIIDKLDLPKQNLNCINLHNYKHLCNLEMSNLCTEQLKPQMIIGQDNYHLLVPLEIKIGKPNEPCATLTPLGWCLHGRSPGHPSTVPRHSLLFVSSEFTENENVLREIHEEVKRSFSLESLGISARPRQNQEDMRAENILERTSTLIDGRWHVGLPWKDEKSVMPDSFPTAMSRLKGVEQKMKKNNEYAQRYRDRIFHLLDNDYAKKLNNDTTQLAPCPSTKTWYLPHFGVDNPNKKKLRLVFDAAARTNGVSLNDYLLKGPDLLASLYGIMLRFREHKIAVSGDIKDMFLRVKMRSEDQNAFRFLYRNDPEGFVDTYAMTSLIFGANCSPFIAQFIKNKNARQHEDSFPAAATAICTQHFMDDYLDSLPDEETAVQLVRDVTEVHSRGGFEMRNWTSNCKQVLDCLPKDSLGDAAVKFKTGQEYEGERTLGLIWYPGDDTLRYDVSFKRIKTELTDGTKRPTKREMLRVLMSIFDVYGFLAPFTIVGKIILQETWKQKIAWDDNITDNIYHKWAEWTSQMKTIGNVRLPRFYGTAAATTARASETEHEPIPRCTSQPAPAPAPAPAPPPALKPAPAPPPAPALAPAPAPAPSPAPAPAPSFAPAPAPAPSFAPAPAPAFSPPPSRETLIYQAVGMNAPATADRYTYLQLHVYCDASMKAMCAVAYWRWIFNNDVYVAFITSRSRVAPVKPVSVPRLELQAAVMAARLAETIIEEHRIKPERKIFWCDSSTVLSWIRNNNRNYKQFVAHRLGEIDERTSSEEWRYVPTSLNIADVATRDVFNVDVLENEWLYGPDFLREPESQWPRDFSLHEPVKNEAQVEVINTIKMEGNEVDLPVPDATRFSSWLRLLRATSAVLKFIYKCRKQTHLFDDMMERAEVLLLRQAQAQSFAREIFELKNNRSLPRSSKLLTLSPYLDEHGVMRLGGRIGAAAGVLPETKNPIILDGKNYIAKLIVKYYHFYFAHGNRESIVNEVKQRYWITRLRPLVKTITSQCMLCRLRKCKAEAPRMGDLPAARLAHHQRPFTYCGVDLFGPMEVTVGRRREKRYGVLFTCLTVRAIHIEVVSSLSSDSFIMALRRMTARRGWPKEMYSDNGTNFKGANTELKKSMQDLDEEVLKGEALNHGTKWVFIPGRSPHWGGAWERLIRIVKNCLSVVLKERAPREETLLTLLVEVENIVNSRPLTHVSVDPRDMETLTPNHFLVGSSSSLPHIGAFDDSDLHLRKQWRIAQRLADMYWRRWVKEVLPDMLPRTKWNEDVRNLQVGDLVLVVDPDGPRNLWPRGVIEEVVPGKDGRVRMVRVRIKGGLLTRSAVRVARIPIVNEYC